MQATLVTAGIVLLAAAIVGGGLKAFNIEVPGLDSIVRQAMLGIFGAVLLVIGLIGIGSDEPGPLISTPTTVAVSSITDPPTTPTVELPTPTLPPVSTTALSSSTTEVDSGTDCQITIVTIGGFSLVSIQEEPSLGAQDVIAVPAGTYQVEAVELVMFGPNEQRWFQITVSGRTGWLRDSTFNIATKSPGCP